MKILQVTEGFSPLYGGSAEVPRQLSRELVKRGHQVTIYTSDFKLRRDYIDSVSQVKVCSFKTWLGLVKFYITPGIIKRAKEEIKHLDIIHMHNYRTFQNIVVHHYAKKYGIPYILQAHGSLTTFFKRGCLKRIFDLVWGYGLLKDASKVIAVTQTEVEQCKSMGVSEDKIEIIPNGVDLSEFKNLPTKGEFRKKYNMDSEQKIILYLGRIDKIKGLDLLAKAFVQVSSNIKDVKLVITGPDDGYLPALTRLIKELDIEERVLFTGPLYGKDKVAAYIDADVYVLPSFYEIFGIAVLEALACGTPVVVTDRCGIADVVNNRAGLVTPYDKEQLQHALLHMISDSKMRAQFGESGKSLVRGKFNWGEIAEQVEDVYQAVLT